MGVETAGWNGNGRSGQVERVRDWLGRVRGFKAFRDVGLGFRPGRPGLLFYEA